MRPTLLPSSSANVNRRTLPHCPADELEAKMCRLSSLLGCCQPNEAFLGCNALWEAALDERAAAMLNSAHFELLLRHLW